MSRWCGRIGDNESILGAGRRVWVSHRLGRGRAGRVIRAGGGRMGRLHRLGRGRVGRVIRAGVGRAHGPLVGRGDGGDRGDHAALGGPENFHGDRADPVGRKHGGHGAGGPIAKKILADRRSEGSRCR